MCKEYYKDIEGNEIWYKEISMFIRMNHRLDGPAKICKSGKKEYAINGKRYLNFLEYIQAVINYKSRHKV